MTIADRRRSAPGAAAPDRSEPERSAFVEPAPVFQAPMAGLCSGEGAGPVSGGAPGHGCGPGLRRRFDADEPDPLGGTAIPGDVIAALRRQSGGGQPLPEPLRQAGGEALGLDLSPVRVHTGPEAARLARSVQASAFTYGHDIYFSANAYRPGEADGQRLISHELGHLGQSGSQSGGVIGRAEGPAEADADRAGAGVLTALRRQASRIGPSTGQPAEADTTDRCHGGLRRRLAAGAVIRRAYTADERPAILGLAQVANSEERLDQLAACNWSRAATVALAQRQPPLSYDQLHAIMRRCTAAQAEELVPVSVSWPELATLATLGWQADDLIVLVDSGWAGADVLALAQAGLQRDRHQLAVLATMQLGGALPTLGQLTAVERFGMGQLMTIAANPSFGDWAEFVHLAEIQAGEDDLTELATDADLETHPWLEDQISALAGGQGHAGIKGDIAGHVDPVFTCWQWATRGLDVAPVSIDLANRYFSYRTNYPDVFGEVMDHAHAREQALSGLADDNPRRDEIHDAERAYLDERQAQLQAIITDWLTGAGPERNGAAQRAIMEMQLTDAGFEVLPPGGAARWYICMHEKQENVSWEHWWIKTRSGDVIETFPGVGLNFHQADVNMGDPDGGVDFRHEVPVRDLLPAQKAIIKREVARQGIDFTDDLP